MRQILLPGNLEGNPRFLLDKETSFHLLRVLRLARGSRIGAADEAGNRFIARLEGVEGGRALLALEPAGAVAAGPGYKGESEAAPGQAARDTPDVQMPPQELPRIALVQGLPKGPKMDLILRQAVETGVELVVPLQTKNSVVRELGREGSSGGDSRRQRILKEALQQSGSLVRTKLCPTTSTEELESLLSAEGFPPENSLYLMFHELDIAGKSLHEYCMGFEGSVVLLIGPEGGFTPQETDAFTEMSFKGFHIPGSILRTETAALFAIAAVKTLLLERKLWTLSN